MIVRMWDVNLVLSADAGYNIETSELLLDHGANVNAGDEWGITPLHYVAKDTCTAMAKLLIDRGAYVNAKTTGGLTSLYAASRNNRKAMTALLLANGADVNPKDNEGRPPVVCKRQRPH
jgi:ankyrin repeat protein